MKAIPLILCLVLVAGCASPRPTVAIQTDGEHGWVTPEDLDGVVKRFVAEKKLDFDFRGLTPHVVVPHSRDYVADVWYGKGIGHSTLMTKISFNREVIEHHIGIAVCGTGLAE